MLTVASAKNIPCVLTRVTLQAFQQPEIRLVPCGCFSTDPQHHRKCRQRKFYGARIRLHSLITHLACFTCLHTCLFSANTYICKPSVNRPRMYRGRANGVRPSSSLSPWPLLWAKPSEWDFPGGPVVKNSPSVQRARIWSLVWERPTWLGAAKPMHHRYWTHTLGPSLYK